MTASIPELMDLVHDAVIIRESDGLIVSWNQAAAERYGYSATEAVGRNLHTLLGPIYSDKDAEEVLRRTGFWAGSVRVSTQDGRILTAPCRLRSIENSQVIEVHGPVASRTESDLRLVIDHLPGLVSYVDSSLRYRFANHVYTEWFGTTEADVIGARVEDLLGAEAFSRVREGMERALSGELVHFDAYLPYVRGAGKHVAVSYVPDRDELTGEVRGFVVLVEDNTARHNSEVSLRASEAQYRQIVETAHEGIWIIGPDARTVFANQRMAELLGTTIEQVLRDHSFTYLFPEEQEEAERLFAAKIGGDREPFEFRLRRADGSAIWARISGVPMMDENGEVIGLLGMFTDITAARAAEHALRESEERFRTLLANMPDIVSRFDRKGRFLYISPAVERATGMPPEAFLGKSHGESGLPEPLASYLSDKLEEIVRSGTSATVNFELTGPGGSVRRYHGLGVPEFGDDGAVRSVLTIVHDVTEQQRVEEALRQSNAELEQFAYAAAHDLQEPLRVVGTYTELLLRRLVTDSDPGSRRVADFIMNAVSRMQALIRDLLTYSQAVHEDSHQRVPMSLDAALDLALATLTEVIQQTEAQILREPLPRVLGEPSQLTQVLQNLLSNALKYARPGVRPVVQITAERVGAEWVVSVKDNGIGFDPKYAERIFGLFKRLHRDAYPGTGVGLGICRRIMERHGGRIWAESEGEGLGAIFRFTLSPID